MTFYKPLITLVSLIFFASFIGCGNNFPLDQNISAKKINLINTDSSEVTFPNILNNKVSVIGFIYTHCPDICPMTTHNMQVVEKKLEKDNVKNVNFVVISFDPDRDTPTILKKYADIRGINLDKWSFLTGDKQNIDTLLKEFNVYAIPGDSTKSNGKWEYYFIHTDRISLVDADGNLRKNFPGSTLNVDNLVKDIKSLD